MSLGQEQIAGGRHRGPSPVKPPPLDYHRPETVDEAVSLLGELGGGGKVLAGGQSLIPLLNMRLAAPDALVDINGLDELDRVTVADGTVRVGAGVRAATLEAHDRAVAASPILGEALGLVAHPVIRNRGTVVGSVVHADPAAELPAVLLLLGGSVTVRGPGGERTIAAPDLFDGPLQSTVAPDELALHVDLPVPPARTGTAVVELARRHGDDALAGVAARVTVDRAGAVTDAQAAFIGVGPVPLHRTLADELAGQPAATPDTAAAEDAARQAVRPTTDIHATAEYRRHLTGVLTGRALRRAAAAAATVARVG